MRDGLGTRLMSRWECDSGHILEGLFYASNQNDKGAGMPDTIDCPYCHSAMSLAHAEGATRLLDKIRDFIGEVSKHPDYKLDSSRALEDLGRLEVSIKKIAHEALRP